MTGIDQDDLAAAVAHWYAPDVRVLDPGPDTRAVIPETCWPVAESTDPAERRRAARDLWNDDLLALLPRHAHALRTALIDVRVARHDHLPVPALYYVLRGDDGDRPRTRRSTVRDGCCPSPATVTVSPCTSARTCRAPR